jgi:hypothetical protein
MARVRLRAKVEDAAEQRQADHHGVHAGQDRHQGRHGAPLVEPEQHERQREDDQLGPDEVLPGQRHGLPEDLLPAPGPHLEQVRTPGDLGDEPGQDLGAHVVGVPRDAHDDQRVPAVLAAQGGGPAAGPVGGRLGHALVAADALGQLPARRFDGGVVHGAAPRRHQEDHVGAAGAEPLLQLGLCPVRLRPRRFEPGQRQPRRRPRRQHAGADQHGQGQREHQPAAADEQEAQPAQRRAGRGLAGGAGAGGHHEISPKTR